MVEERPFPTPLRSIDADADGKLSFVLDIDGRRIEYGPDGADPALTPLWPTVSQEGMSIAAFEMQIGPAQIRQRMLVANLPEGAFCYLHAGREHGSKYGYVCAPRIDGQLHLAQERFFTADDTLLDRVMGATSFDLLKSSNLEAMAQPLEKLVSLSVPKGNAKEETERRQSVNFARRILDTVLPAYKRYKQQALAVATTDEWKKCVQQETTAKFLLLQPALQPQLKADPKASHRDILRLHSRRNGFCFVGMPVSEVQKIVPSVTPLKS
jgi:hypothetical protein